MIRAVLVAFALTGCVSEYHPEYHPVSIVNIEQRHVSDHATKLADYHAPDPDYATLFPRGAPSDPFVEAASVPTPVPEARTVVIGRGVYIGSGVNINGNVTINGDVYISTSH